MSNQENRGGNKLLWGALLPLAEFAVAGLSMCSDGEGEPSLLGIIGYTLINIFLLFDGAFRFSSQGEESIPKIVGDIISSK